MDKTTNRDMRALEIVSGPATARSARHSIQSVDRAVSLLEAIAEAGGECTLTELSHRTKLNISTCHHLLSTLVSPRLCGEGAGAALLRARRAHPLSQQCLPAAGRPAGARRAVHREDQRADRRDRASRGAAGRRDDEVAEPSRHAVRVDTGTLGQTDAAHATATGKAMLAWLPEDDMRRVLAHGMTRFTPKTITEWPGLIEA